MQVQVQVQVQVQMQEKVQLLGREQLVRKLRRDTAKSRYIAVLEFLADLQSWRGRPELL